MIRTFVCKCVAPAAALGVLIAATSAHASVDRYIDLESASINSSTWKLTNNGVTYANSHQGTGLIPKLNTTLKRSGSYSLEFTADASTEVREKDRTEYYFYQNASMGIQKFSGFSFRLSNAYFPPVENWFLLHQWHQSSPESPPIALEIAPGTDNVLRTVIRYGVDNSNKKVKNFDNPIAKGQWIDIVTQWKIDTTDGIFKMWINRELKVDYAGPIGYSGVEDQLIDEKFGIYRDDQNLKHQLHYDQIRVGDSYAEVDPSQ